MATLRVGGFLGFLSLVILASINIAAGQQQPPRTCINTGLTCIESCAGLADGNYQWCGSCQWFIQCSEGVTYYQPCNGNLYWHDDVKACVSVSDTCAECVVHTSPNGFTDSTIRMTTIIASLCESTGPDCIDHCDVTHNGVYQWCARCDYFLLCSGSEEYYMACPPGLWYDHTVEACIYNSTTCRQCYDGSGSTPVNGCGSSPCLNGGTCINSGNGFVCTCPSGYTGIRCETPDPCWSGPCLNGGTCSNLGGSFDCDCPIEWTGTRCEIPASGCDPSPCLNGGTCVDLGGGAIDCNCPVEWTGVICESPNYIQNMTCGSELIWSGYPASNGFTRLCYFTADPDDIEGRATECHNTIRGIPLYNDDVGLLAAGGNFGCLVSINYPEDLPGTSLISCADNYQQDVTLGSYNVSAILMVCLRYPYEGIPRV